MWVGGGGGAGASDFFFFYKESKSKKKIFLGGGGGGEGGVGWDAAGLSELTFNDILHMSFLAGTHVFKAYPAYTTAEI